MWIVHDEARRHSSRTTREFLNNNYIIVWWMRTKRVACIIRSVDLNSPVYLWGHFETFVYDTFGSITGTRCCRRKTFPAISSTNRSRRILSRRNDVYIVIGKGEVSMFVRVFFHPGEEYAPKI